VAAADIVVAVVQDQAAAVAAAVQVVVLQMDKVTLAVAAVEAEDLLQFQEAKLEVAVK
jgi:hypothetical protein